MYRTFARFMVIVSIAFGLTMCVSPQPSPSVASAPSTKPLPSLAQEMFRLTGADKDTFWRWSVCGTDLGIPFTLENGSIGYLFGDTHEVADPFQQTGLHGWRSPVILRSNDTPRYNRPPVFDSAAGVDGDGMAPSVIPGRHLTGDQVSIIPTDGISFPETGAQVISYQSIRSWIDDNTQNWQTNYAGLAISHDGNTFVPAGPFWRNSLANDDPFQMWSMQRDGDYVYIVTVRAGRQTGPMMLLRVPWDKMLDPDAYQCLNVYEWGSECRPMASAEGPMIGRYGEPSFRLLSDGTWVLNYLDADKLQIVTRTTTAPGKPWSDPKVQVAWDQFPSLYGGYIHPRSTRSNLMLMVSSWIIEPDRRSTRYDVTYFQGTT